jgi:hypothetical protein
MTETDAQTLQHLLKERDGLGHLQVRQRGKNVTIVTDVGTEDYPHARFTSLGGGVWGLSLPRHTGRWERTPVIGSLQDVTAVLVRDFGFYLTDPR